MKSTDKIIYRRRGWKDKILTIAAKNENGTINLANDDGKIVVIELPLIETPEDHDPTELPASFATPLAAPAKKKTARKKAAKKTESDPEDEGGNDPENDPEDEGEDPISSALDPAE